MSLQTPEIERSGRGIHSTGLRTGRRAKPGPRKEKESPVDRYLAYAFFGFLILCIAAAVYILLNPAAGEKYTEFYIPGPEEKAYNNYSISLESGETGTVYINVVNREQKPVEYLLKVFLGNETVQEKEFLLADRQAYKARFTFTPHTAGDKRLGFILCKKGYTTPCQDLHLSVDVKQEGGI